MTGLDVAMILFTLLLGIIWMFAVADLMGRRESEFPSPSDKLCWTILLTFTFIAGAIIWLWKRPRVVSSELSYDASVIPDEPVACMKCGTTIPPLSETCPKCGWSWS